MTMPFKPRPFRHKAVYEFTCVCGFTMESEAAEGRCPKCQRLFEIHNWGGRATKNVALIRANKPMKETDVQ